MEEYQVKSKYEADDYGRYTNEICKKTYGKMFFYFLIIVFLSMIITNNLEAVMKQDSIQKIIPSEASSLISVFLSLLTPLILILYLSKYFKLMSVMPDAYFTADKTFTLNNSGIREQSKYHDSFTDWKGVIDISENKYHILFYIDNTAALIINKKSFNDDNEKTEFLTYARKLWQDSINTTLDAKNPWTKNSIESNPEQKDT